MAYQSGNFRPKQKGTSLTNLANSLQKFGGVYADKQAIEEKKRSLEIQEQEDMEIRKANEIFKGEMAGDIQQEFDFSTKAGNDKYQSLRARDLIDTNFQKAREEGSRNNWNVEETNNYFSKLNNAIINDKKTFDDTFIGFYAENAVKYENELKNMAAKESIANINEQVKHSNTSTFVNGIMNRGNETSLETLGFMKERLGANYQKYIPETLNIITTKGGVLSEEAYKQFSKEAEGDIAIANALASYNKAFNSKKVNANAYLKKEYEVNMTKGNIDGMLDFGSKYRETLSDTQKDEFDVKQSEDLLTTSTVNELINSATNGDMTTFTNILNNEDTLNYLGDGAKNKLKKNFEDRTFGSYNYDELDSSQQSLLNNYISTEGIPSSMAKHLRTKAETGSFEEMKKSIPLFDMIKDYPTIYNKNPYDKNTMKQFELAKMIMTESNLNNTDAQLIFDERKKKLTGNYDWSKEKKIEDINKDKDYVAEKIRQSANGFVANKILGLQDRSDEYGNTLNGKMFRGITGLFGADYTSEEDMDTLRKTGFNQDELINIVQDYSYSTGVDLDTAYEKVIGNDFLQRKYIKSDFGNLYYNISDNAINNSKIINKNLKSYINKNLINEDGSWNAEWNASPDLINSVDEWNVFGQDLGIRSDLDMDDFTITADARTKKDGSIPVMFVDENGINRYITKKNGEQLRFFPQLEGELKTEALRMKNGATDLKYSKEILEDALNNSLDQLELSKLNTIPVEGAELTVRNKESFNSETVYSPKIYGGKKINDTKLIKGFKKDLTKQKEKAKVKEINTYYPKEDVSMYKEKIKSDIENGKTFINGFDYATKMAFAEMDSQKLIDKDMLNDLKNDIFDGFNELYSNFGINGKMIKKINLLTKQKENQKMQKFQRTEYRHDYSKSGVYAKSVVQNKLGIEYQAKQQDRMFTLSDLFQYIESGNGTNTYNKISSATGNYQFLVWNGGDNNNGYVKSSANTAFNRAVNTFGIDNLPEELIALDKLGKNIGTGDLKSPQAQAFRKKFNNLSQESQDLLFMANTYQMTDKYEGKGSSYYLKQILNGNKEEAKEGMWALYAMHHSNAGESEKRRFNSFNFDTELN